MFAALDPAEPVLRLAVAALGGLAVGIEREWSAKAAGGIARFAGVRTFLLLGLIGGLVGELHRSGASLAGATLIVAAAAVAVAAYAAAALRGHTDSTTEIAALVVLAAGTMAGLGSLRIASAVFAVTAFALAEKSRIHSFVDSLPSSTIVAAARFAVLALVVLPILPAGPFGPEPGLRPRELWVLVLVFSGLGFAGYLALLVVGGERGYGIAGLLGGLVSSTAVTLGFARESRATPDLGGALALGVLGACTVLFARMTVLAALVAPRVAEAAFPLLAVPFLAGSAAGVLLLRRGRQSDREPPTPDNPLRLASAIQMAIAFQLVLWLVHHTGARFGDAGTLGTAALLGLTDVDALTYSMAKLGREPEMTAVAARALAVGALSNTIVKLGIAIALGRGVFRRSAAAGLGFLVVSSIVSLIFFST